MKNIFLLAALILISFTGVTQICTPDTSLKDPGIYPSALPAAQNGIAYEQAMTVVSLKDTTIDLFGIPIQITIDSIVLTSIDSLPSVFTYECLPVNCTYSYTNPGCIVIKGTPNDITLVGSYRLMANITIYSADAALLGQSPAYETIDMGEFNINPGVGIGELSNSAQFNIYPQPSNNKLNIDFTNQFNKAVISIMDLTGKYIVSQESDYQQSISINTNLQSGLYLLEINLDGKTTTEKIIISN